MPVPSYKSQISESNYTNIGVTTLFLFSQFLGEARYFLPGGTLLVDSCLGDQAIIRTQTQYISP